jgi:hypothetical protein
MLQPNSIGQGTINDFRTAELRFDMLTLFTSATALSNFSREAFICDSMVSIFLLSYQFTLPDLSTINT